MLEIFWLCSLRVGKGEFMLDMGFYYLAKEIYFENMFGWKFWC